MTLANLKKGCRARIKFVHSENIRLMEIGFIEGVEVIFINSAPLGDPLHVRVGDCEVAIRREDARLMEVEEIP